MRNRNRNRGIPGNTQTMEHATMWSEALRRASHARTRNQPATCNLQCAFCLAQEPHTSRIAHRPVVVALSATWTWGPGSSECLSRGALVAVIRPTEILAASAPVQAETETAIPIPTPFLSMELDALDKKSTWGGKKGGKAPEMPQDLSSIHLSHSTPVTATGKYGNSLPWPPFFLWDPRKPAT